MVDKTDLKWLRENHFRKQRNEQMWYTSREDSRGGKEHVPFFWIEVVHHDGTGYWHARVSTHKEYIDVNLMINKEACQKEWGVPEHWNEDDWADCQLGCAVGLKSGKAAVSLAVHRAAGFARWILNEKYYNISDLERDFPMEKKEGRDAVGE